MKKIFYSMTMAALTLGVTACGGNNESASNSGQALDEAVEAAAPAEEEKPDYSNVQKTATVTVADGNFAEGDLADFIAIVPGDYIFNFAAETERAEIKLKLRPKGLSFNDVSCNTNFEILDTDGNQLGKIVIYSGQSALSEALQEGNTADAVEITAYYFGNKYNDSVGFEQFMARANKLRGLKAVSINDSGNSSSSSASSSSSSSSAGSDFSGNSYVSAADLQKYIENGMSDDIDRMLSAMEWENKVEKQMKPRLRALDEDAIRAKIAIDKASEKIGEKYDRHSISGALDDISDQMTDAQNQRYAKACANTVFVYTANENGTDYQNLYRKLRYGL